MPNKSSWILLSFIILGLAASVSVFRSATAQKSDEAEENNWMKTENPDAYREHTNSENLSSLLTNKEVNHRESNLLPNTVKGAQTIHVQFKTANADFSESKFSPQKPAANLLEQTSLRASSATLARQRSFELSPSQILILSVDRNKEVLWWDLQPDPRFFKAETADDFGVLSGQTLYLNNASMLVNIPAAEQITELYFYSPNWNGRTYSLELIGNLEIAK